MDAPVLESKSQRLGRLALVAGVVAVIFGCAERLTLQDIGWSPHERVQPVLQMGKHLKRGLECADCHEGAAKSDEAGMPKREFCMDCHEDIEKHEARLAKGGPIFDVDGKPKWGVVTSLPESVSFSHAKHTKTLKCAECHGDVEHDRYSQVSLAATRLNCLRCHTDDGSPDGCRACHGGMAGRERPHSHDADWKRVHGRKVRSMVGSWRVESTCNECHKRSECVDCHQRERPRNHTSLWVRAGHGLAASFDRNRCSECHKEDRCISCHLDGADPVPGGWHPSAGDCSVCHTRLRRHVLMTDNCRLCHR